MNTRVETQSSFLWLRIATPECEFTSWDKPVGRSCPKCDHYLVEKKVRGGSKQVVCPNGDYEEEKVKSYQFGDLRSFQICESPA